MATTQTQQGALKIKEAAQYLGGISVISVRRLVKRGDIRPNRCLRVLLFPLTELDRFLARESRPRIGEGKR
jgi:Helix-turn-helix domain